MSSAIGRARKPNQTSVGFDRRDGWIRHEFLVMFEYMQDFTQTLLRISQGDPSATDQLLPLVYQELRNAAQARLRHERADHTLQATALVHEVYLRLMGQEQTWDSRGHFLAAASEAMRRILVESVRRKKAAKRGGDFERIEWDTLDIAAANRDEKLLALDAALNQFEEVYPVKANLVKLRFFAGLTRDEAADALGISSTTADRHWSYARSWLQKAMRSD